jgi:hypothetical protein
MQSIWIGWVFTLPFTVDKREALSVVVLSMLTHGTSPVPSVQVEQVAPSRTVAGKQVIHAIYYGFLYNNWFTATYLPCLVLPCLAGVCIQASRHLQEPAAELQRMYEPWWIMTASMLRSKLASHTSSMLAADWL